jgi:hypothetical protein
VHSFSVRLQSTFRRESGSKEWLIGDTKHFHCREAAFHQRQIVLLYFCFPGKLLVLVISPSQSVYCVSLVLSHRVHIVLNLTEVYVFKGCFCFTRKIPAMLLLWTFLVISIGNTLLPPPSPTQSYLSTEFIWVLKAVYSIFLHLFIHLGAPRLPSLI